MRWRAGTLALATTILAASSIARSQTSAKAFRFTKIAEGVYHVTGTGRLPVGGNTIVIVNEQEVMLVDASISPLAARTLLSELAEITTKPVKYVVNTHFHFDHTNGNQTFGPGVEIIGHEYTQDKIASGKFRNGVAWSVLNRMIGVREDSAQRLSMRQPRQRPDRSLRRCSPRRSATGRHRSMTWCPPRRRLPSRTR